MSTSIRRSVIAHQVARLDIPVREGYDDFRRRYESAVPPFNRERATELVAQKAPWSEVAAGVTASAPHDFLIYWKLDLSPLMSLAGHTLRATEYLMGNHVIAETMYRYDPGVALYVPLRCAIYETDEGVRFAIDQPSTMLASLGRDEIKQVGLDLDRKLARLLAVLGVAAPAELLQARTAP